MPEMCFVIKLQPAFSFLRHNSDSFSQVHLLLLFTSKSKRTPQFQISSIFPRYFSNKSSSRDTYSSPKAEFEWRSRPNPQESGLDVKHSPLVLLLGAFVGWSACLLVSSFGERKAASQFQTGQMRTRKDTLAHSFTPQTLLILSTTTRILSEEPFSLSPST